MVSTEHSSFSDYEVVPGPLLPDSLLLSLWQALPWGAPTMCLHPTYDHPGPVS